MKQRKLAYLSGAPRVSTRLEAEATGPKSHVLGVIRAFESLGWDVKPFIVGDRVPINWIRTGARRQLSRNVLSRTAADLLRIGMNYQNSRKAVREIGQVDWAYERFGAFQSLGRIFQRRGIPWILETNAPLFHEAKFDARSMELSRLARYLELRAYRECDVLVCVTQALKDIIVQEGGISPSKIIVLPNGVDTALLDPQNTKTSRLFDLPTIGFVGSVMEWQALDLLIHALGELKADGIDLGLTIVGDGPAREQWERLVTQIGLQNRIRFMGHVAWESIPQYIAGFDLCYSGQVATSTGQMYLSPLKLYEYLSMGKPVVASAYEDAQRLLKDGKGYLFTPGDKDSLKNALRTAYAQRSNWAEIGRRSRNEIVQNHSWEARVRELTGQVQKMLGKA